MPEMKQKVHRINLNAFIHQYQVVFIFRIYKTKWFLAFRLTAV